MTAQGFALFDTAIGACGIAWSERGVAGVQLPEARAGATRARMRRRFPEARESAPPPDVRRTLDDIAALLRGAAIDLSGVALDFAGVPPFHRQVYELARTIPPGGTLTYGALATRLGKPGSARAVGQALGNNPFAVVVPCHRVVAAGGKPGGFSANGGAKTKLRMLAIERDGGGFAFDPASAIEHVRAADKTLARVIDRVGPFKMQLLETPDLFGALLKSIVHQQLGGKAAATIHGRVLALFPTEVTPDAILGASDEALRGAGLSRSKLLSIRDLARRAADGAIPSLAEARRLDDEALIERLTEVRGIGRWTVEMLLMFRLGRPDVLPVDDYGIKKGFQITFKKRELPAPADIAGRGARWKPYRTLASWYLWRAVDLAP